MKYLLQIGVIVISIVIGLFTFTTLFIGREISKTNDFDQKMHCMNENNHCNSNVDTSDINAVVAANECFKAVQEKCN